MLLTVDIGNTATTCGVFEENGRLKALFSFKTFVPVSAEELLVKIKTYLDLYQIEFKKLEGISIACVVPPVLNWWVEVGKRWLAKEVLIANHETVNIPLDLLYPCEVGADRLVNALAGWEKYKGPLIIVDFGTAITFDCISSTGVYLGGAIAPGIFISTEALFKGTAKLPKIDLSEPPTQAIGKDTISALKSGLLIGFAGLTDTLVKKLSEEIGSNPKVIATGGLAKFLVPLTTTIEKIDPYLTLEGLYFLWKARLK
ncbi:type III pantothenate kinase [Thermodesulfobacterium sp.]|jgi:type III pantothenate kinase|uniref:type III pantothenate kinase n=1 Tax=Thermodesulfobacterium sp. TaxID=1965289 RepID=UPI002648F860|nr:type III pantothenate kinase [Thermodesulfobacterium sp.]MDK2861389.1 type pantothenate kinase [Thermodesulfobacterium sp.]MDN5379472.1 type pantothenate kinase [Thermodesulfobacterium sp.]